MAKYILKRILYMIPTLFVISIISFVVIQLPPGDFLTTYVAQLAEQGNALDAQAIKALEEQYGLNQPIYVQDRKWLIGLLLPAYFRPPISALRSRGSARSPTSSVSASG